MFDEGLALAGKPSKERGKTVYRIDSNEALNHLLGIKWDERIFNENGDFAFVFDKTVRFWLSRKTAIQEFKVIGGKYIRSEIEDNLCVVFTFVRGDGNKHNYATKKLIIVIKCLHAFPFLFKKNHCAITLYIILL